MEINVRPESKRFDNNPKYGVKRTQDVMEQKGKLVVISGFSGAGMYQEAQSMAPMIS